MFQNGAREIFPKCVRGLSLSAIRRARLLLCFSWISKGVDRCALELVWIFPGRYHHYAASKQSGINGIRSRPEERESG
jgi:hypothetical protein